MPCKIYYFSLEDEQTKTEKLEWFKNTKLQDIDFQLIKPDKNANWINLADENNGFDDLIPVCSKDAKLGKGGNAIFELYSLGVVTNRDEWVYDFDKENLKQKVNFLIDKYNQEVERLKGISKDDIRNEIEYSIKWTRAVKNDLSKGKKYIFDESRIITSLYRPFIKQYLYFSKNLNEMQYQNPVIFGEFGNLQNICLCCNGSNNTTWNVIATKTPIDLNALYGGSQCLPLYRYSNGERLENITDWALALFRGHYENYPNVSPTQPSPQGGLKNSPPFGEGQGVGLCKLDIFHYVYAVLHKPEYRTTYEQNLKREFPRIPLYADFWKYAAAGKKLMELHLNYENSPTQPSPQGGLQNSPPFGEGQGVGLLVRKDIDLEVFKAGKAGKKKNSPLSEMSHHPEGGTMHVGTDVNTPPSGGGGLIYPILKIRDGNIEIDELTMLCGVPAQALAYKLGNRSAIEWILDQYKPYKSDDKTIQEQFNNYNFADYKEQVIELLQKVCWLSVETMKIVGEL